MSISDRAGTVLGCGCLLAPVVSAVILAVVWIGQGTAAAEVAAWRIAGVVMAALLVVGAISAVVDWVKKNLL
ncbi:hypothetical protein OHU26_20930 [Streptomyces sp. NBC_00069]